MNPLLVTGTVLGETFRHFRECGMGKRECQVLWAGPWDSPRSITRAVHSHHRAHGAGFQVDDAWLNRFWLELAELRQGIRAQVHTHAFKAFHSKTDDDFPIIHTSGFLSLVIPNFGMGPTSLDQSFLCGIDDDGAWMTHDPKGAIAITP